MFKNILKTFVLLAALNALFIVLGYFFGGYSAAWIMLFISLGFDLVMYWFSSSIVLKSSGAKPMEEAMFQDVYSITRELSRKMSIPMPKLYIIEQDQANAFATGRNPSHGVVCLTTGIIRILSREELEGVIGHELAHIKNRDILIATIASAFASGISAFTNIFMFFGSNDDEDRNPIVEIALIILAPIIAMIIQLSISRSREYMADETSARTTKNPKALASALEKIENSILGEDIPQIREATASLYIENPFKRRKGARFDWLSTHPATIKRIERLNEIKIS